MTTVVTVAVVVTIVVIKFMPSVVFVVVVVVVVAMEAAVVDRFDLVYGALSFWNHASIELGPRSPPPGGIIISLSWKPLMMGKGLEASDLAGEERVERRDAAATVERHSPAPHH
mmetsp:Transcript_76645/g.219952  ORF Transcript_76645/g.219952 Transcript_76645/m.219952 type:complete len:114 (-) Transcript_76645:302-643(-)